MKDRNLKYDFLINAIDSIMHSINHFKIGYNARNKKVKYFEYKKCIISLINSIESIFKGYLYNINKFLIYKNIDNYEANNGHTLMFCMELLNRIKTFTKFKDIDKYFDLILKMYNYRNKATHEVLIINNFENLEIEIADTFLFIQKYIYIDHRKKFWNIINDNETKGIIYSLSEDGEKRLRNCIAQLKKIMETNKNIEKYKCPICNKDTSYIKNNKFICLFCNYKNIVSLCTKCNTYCFTKEINANYICEICSPNYHYEFLSKPLDLKWNINRDYEPDVIFYNQPLGNTSYYFNPGNATEYPVQKCSKCGFGNMTVYQNNFGTDVLYKCLNCGNIDNK